MACKAAAQHRGALDDHPPPHVFTPTECANYFRAAGYEPE